jgi:hypothetical protein
MLVEGRRQALLTQKLGLKQAVAREMESECRVSVALEPSLKKLSSICILFCFVFHDLPAWLMEHIELIIINC